MVKDYGNMLRRFYLIPECHEQTDGQMDGQSCYINITAR